MKKITLLFLSLFALILNAQTTVWSDDFEDQDISDWTLTDVDGDGNNWGDQFTVNDGGGTPVTPVSLISRSWLNVALTPNNWVVSPVINLSNASGTITVDYITQVAAAAWDEEVHSIYVGTSNDIAVLVNSTITMKETLGDVGNTGTPVNHSFDISAMAGEAVVYIAFRHWDCTDQDYLSIDDVTVLAQTVLGVEDLQTNNFNHFYNGESDILSLKSSNLSFDSIELYNIIGQQVLNRNLSQTNETINLSSLKDGIYIAKVNIEGNTQTLKLLKN